MPLRFTHRFAAYCALLAMLCQLLLPFAHAAVMAQEASAAWCGTGPQPKVQWSLDEQQDSPAEQSSKMMFCSVCAMVSMQAIAPPPAAIVLPLVSADIVSELAADSAEFSYSSYAIPPPPRGPPLIS